MPAESGGPFADINGNGYVDAADAEYLSRHLAGWSGYENLSDFYEYIEPNLDSVVWEMSFSANSLYIDLNVKSEPKFRCPKCGGIVRKCVDFCLTTFPPQYRYDCDDCEYNTTFTF